MGVNWKDIIGYEGLYKISDNGWVINIKRGKHLKNATNEYGYPFCILSKNGQFKNFKIHRLVALHFVDNPFNFKEVNHIDGNKNNNNVANLEWCTRSHNLKHAVRLGLNPKRKGEKAPHAKLTEKIAFEILGSTQPVSELAKRFNVSMSCILSIKTRKTWKHLKVS